MTTSMSEESVPEVRGTRERGPKTTIKLETKDGAPGRTRTCGPLLRRQMLYPLSYGSTSLSAADVSMPLGLVQKNLRDIKRLPENLPVAFSPLKNERSKTMPRV